MEEIYKSLLAEATARIEKEKSSGLSPETIRLLEVLLNYAWFIENKGLEPVITAE